MLYSSRAGVNLRWLGLMAVCFAVMVGSVSSNAVAQTTNLYFSGTCTDCTGTGNLALTVPDLVEGNQANTPASVTYSSNLLGNLVSDPTSGQIFAGIVDTTVMPGAQFMEVAFSAVNASGQYQLYAFTSCGNSSLTGASGNLLCGPATQVATGTLGYGDWQIQEGVIFSTTSSLPAGVGNKVQDYGTNGVWSEVGSTTPVPVPLPASLGLFLVGLVGSALLVRYGRSRIEPSPSLRV
jgi:hypothetical protein